MSGRLHVTLAVAVIAAGAAAVVWLIGHGRLAQAGILFLLLLGYVVVEALVFEAQHPPVYRTYRSLADRDAARGMADYTPQTVDREWEWWEAGRP